MTKDVNVYKENNVWYVSYNQDGEIIISEPFVEMEDAMKFSLNLKFI